MIQKRWKMVTDVAFKYFKNIVGRKVEKRGVWQVKIERKETIWKELLKFNSKMVRPSCRSSSTLNIMQSRYQGGKLIRIIGMKIFVDKQSYIDKNVSDNVSNTKF